MMALKPAENGAAERNRTSDPVITNEGTNAQTRSFPCTLRSEVAYYPLKVRKSAQECARKYAQYAPNPRVLSSGEPCPDQYANKPLPAWSRPYGP